MTWLKRGQRGDGKIGLILALIVVVGVGYLIMKWVPVRTQNAEFSEFVERSAQRLAINELSEQQLMDEILRYAEKEHIPLTEPNVFINVSGDKITVRAKYTVNIPLIAGKVWSQDYTVATETRRF